jgi:phosphoribosylaminoimidazole-succinocarboxamide synthase
VILGASYWALNNSLAHFSKTSTHFRLYAGILEVQAAVGFFQPLTHQGFELCRKKGRDPFPTLGTAYDIWKHFPAKLSTATSHESLINAWITETHVVDWLWVFLYGRDLSLQKIYSGKTKDVFTLEDGNILLKFKDTVTGSDGNIDSGGNEVIGEVAGKGGSSFHLTLYFFELLQKAGIPTHFVAVGPEDNTIIVKAARSYGLEVICREKAWGSFVRRYAKYIEEGTPLPSLVEFTIKDDERGDPLITKEAVVALGIASLKAVEYMEKTAQTITALLKADLAKKNLELIDIKFEFGEVNGKPLLIDEISGDSMRVVRDGRVLLQNELAEAVLS